MPKLFRLGYLFDSKAVFVDPLSAVLLRCYATGKYFALPLILSGAKRYLEGRRNAILFLLLLLIATDNLLFIPCKGN